MRNIIEYLPCPPFRTCIAFAIIAKLVACATVPIDISGKGSTDSNGTSTGSILVSGHFGQQKKPTPK